MFLPALAAFALTGTCLAPQRLLAAPRLPTDPAEVLERLPMRPGDATARELAGQRAAVARAARDAPDDPLPAAQLAGRYYELAVARGAPRYIGYADAVLAPFARSRTPAVLAVRGQLRQYRHDFDGALEDFAGALEADPQFAWAHAWRGAIYLAVQTGNGTGNVEGNGLRHTSNHGRFELEALGAGCDHGRYPVLKAPTGAGGSAPNLRCRDGQRFETGAIEVRSKNPDRLYGPVNCSTFSAGED